MRIGFSPVYENPVRQIQMKKYNLHRLTQFLLFLLLIFLRLSGSSIHQIQLALVCVAIENLL